MLKFEYKLMTDSLSFCKKRLEKQNKEILIQTQQINLHV